MLHFLAKSTFLIETFPQILQPVLFYCFLDGLEEYCVMMQVVDHQQNFAKHLSYSQEMMNVSSGMFPASVAFTVSYKRTHVCL